ncbi:replication protein RepA [Rhodococcus sp. ACS1]|nr:replication protein RepA [Rhodococcus sp. ACS1]
MLLPYRPYATNDYTTGQRRRSRDDALLMKYIQHSPHALIGSIVIDCDHPDAAMRAFEQPRDHPAPSWVAQSPSGRAHLGWWLDSPVCRTDSARLKPLRFAQRVEAGLRLSVDGDFSYGGMLTKNPIHPSWETIYGPSEPYSLRDLVTPLTPRQMPRRPDRAAGLGRNVTLFDTARKWTYRQWWSHRDDTDRVWDQLVLRYCMEINNNEFAVPLPFRETMSTAYSISRWTRRNFTEDGFRAIQSARGRITTPAKVEANRKRRTRIEFSALLEAATL